MAISYEEALATLKSMFTSQGYTAQQLDAVLRHHGGHMENTVETLLHHGDGTPDELMQKLPSIPVGSSANNNAASGRGFDADEELARQLAAEDERQSNNNRGSTQTNLGMGMASAMGANRRSIGQRRPMASNATVPSPARKQPAAARSTPQPPAGTKGIGTHTTLPADFLRIPGQKYPAPATNPSNNNISDPIASASGPGGVGQMMSDEQLARMLQDELFQEELRNNPEFSHLAGRRNPRAGYPSGGGRGQSTGRSTYSGAAGGGGADALFEKLSELGDVAKSRFQAFAASWNDPNRQTNSQSSRPLFGGLGGGSQSNVNAGNERRGLLADDLNMEEGEELEFVGGHEPSGNVFEMNDVGGGSTDKKKD